MLLGSAEYISPEEARGQSMFARAEVFSVAGVFYFMLSGRPPFGSRDLRNVLQAIINDPPPALTDEQAPEALRQLLAKGLAKDPAQRYQQCADMRADIEQVRRTITVSTSRMLQAARDRYQQTLALIEERRTVGRSLGLTDTDASCDDAAMRIKVRFPTFAETAGPVVQMDPAAAKAALESLQGRHNAEQAALATLRERAREATRSSPTARPRGSFWRGLLKVRGN
jgi:hypothetical protein